MNPCARCKGNGDEGDLGQFMACQMCGGSGEAVPCRAPKNAASRTDQRLFGTYVYCGRPSVAWDDESPRCHRHDPEVVRAVRDRVARARERVLA